MSYPHRYVHVLLLLRRLTRADGTLANPTNRHAERPGIDPPLSLLVTPLLMSTAYVTRLCLFIATWLISVLSAAREQPGEQLRWVLPAAHAMIMIVARA